MQLLKRKPETLDRSRDLTAILRAAEQPLEMEQQIASVVQDSYGIRGAQHEDITLAEEFTELAQRIDNMIAAAKKVYDSLVDEAEQLKVELRSRGTDLTAHIAREKSVAEAYREELAVLRDRIKTRLDAEQASNGEQQ